MDDDGRLDRVEAKLDRLIEALYTPREEPPEPVLIPIEDVPGPDEPDRPTLPAFPRPVEVKAPLPTPPAAVDPETGTRLDEPIGATPVTLQTGDDVTYSPSRQSIATMPEIINREYFTTLARQRAMVPLEDRPR